MDHYEAAGQAPAALQAALSLIERDPLREDAHRLVMRVYARQGRRNAALEQYARCRDFVQAELGVEPTTETNELYQSILTGRFAVQPLPVPVSAAEPPALSISVAGHNPLELAAPSVLVGRDGELTLLYQRWQQARSGRSQLVLLYGETGVGKTRLVETFADQLRSRGAAVLWGRCYEFERRLPFQPIADALTAVLSRMSGAELAHLPDWVNAALARLLPLVVEKLPRLAEYAGAEIEQGHGPLFNGVTHFFSALSARSPLLLIVEDLHWASESTLELLHHLVRHLAGQPVLFVGTVRHEALEPGHALWSLQQHLQGEQLAQSYRLERLSSEAVTALIEKMSGAGERIRPLAEWLYAETEGNPFFLVEIVKAFFETGVLSVVDGVWRGDFDRIRHRELALPATIRDTVEARVRRLKPDSQEALRWASVLGREFDFDLLSAVWQHGQDEETTLGVLDDLLRYRLIAEGAATTDRDYVFTHHKIQEVVYADIPVRRQQFMHARAAASIEALYDTHLDAFAGELAFHCEQGRQIDKAITYLRLAGEQAAAQFANSEAIDYFSCALTLTPETDRAGRYGLVLARERICDIQGARDAQAQDLAALEELAQVLSDDHRAEVALRRANYAEATGDYSAAIEAAQAAVTLVQNAKNTRIEAVGYLQQGRALLRRGDYVAAQARLEQALILARSAHLSKVEADSLRSLGIISYNQSQFGEAKAHYEQALNIYRAIGERRNESGTLNNLGLVLSSMGDPDRARLHYEQALRIFQETGDRRGEGIVFNNLGIIARRQGDIAGARAYYEGSLDIRREIGDRRGEGIALSNLGTVARSLGEYDRATDYHEQALRIHREVGDRTGEGQVLLESGIDAAHQGHYREARTCYEQCQEICLETGDRRTQGWAMANLGLLSHHLGADEIARDCCQQALAIAQEVGSQPIKGYALTNLGHALVESAHHAEASDVYQQAMTVQRELGQLHLIVEPLAGLARASLAEGNVTQATARVEEILAHLANHTLDGTEEPLRVYLTCYRVLHTVQDPRAPALLKMAYDLLRARAENIHDEHLRRSFLENVPAHRNLIAAITATE